METTERDSQDIRIIPSVSKEKWAIHARTKLANGYVLVVNDQRRNANFFRPGKGYEMCAFKVAIQLVREGSVTHAYDHHLGTAYMLTSDAAAHLSTPQPTPRTTIVLDEDVLIQQLATDLENDSALMDSF